MNFLAHLFLSPNDSQKMIGNFVADAIKGKDIFNYSAKIQEGVQLHRRIDLYTDNHPIVTKSANLIKSDFNKYSSVVVDIYYDHFLTKHWNHFSQKPLHGFVIEFYKLLMENFDNLPPKTRKITPFLIGYNWLENYDSFISLNQVFRGMSMRTNFNSRMENGVDVLKKNYTEIENDFLDFFPDLINNFPENINEK